MQTTGEQIMKHATLDLVKQLYDQGDLTLEEIFQTLGLAALRFAVGSAPSIKAPSNAA